MRRFTHPARRGLCLPLLIAGIAVTASCSTSPTREPEPTGADDDRRHTPVADRRADDRERRDSPHADLFAHAEGALDNGDWMGAELALPVADDSGDREFAAYVRYIQARIAWQRGHLDSMSELLDSLPGAALSDALTLKILQLQQHRAHLERRYLAAARLSIRRLEHLPREHPDATTIAAQAWQALQRVPTATLRSASTGTENDPQAGWLAAGLAHRLQTGTGNWQSRYPGHPAGRFLSPDTAAPQPQRVALLLPLGGRIADAAAAVRDGFIRHYFAQRAAGAIDWDLIVLDTGQHASTTDAYNAAIDSGAQLVVGPLTKTAVTDLLAAESLPVPVIALNRVGDAAAVHDNSLQFALAPEDEAAQIARLAFADGHRRALIARPAGEWGDKMDAALRASWLRLGGDIPAVATFSSRETHSSSLSTALDLDASRQRATNLRRQLAQSIETSGRRRRDIDTVFLLAPGAGDARSLMPLLSYHYAGNLPAYATSSANSDEGRGRESDLNGLTLVEMPHVLGRTPGTEGGELRGDAYTRLGALGADACRLASLGMRPPADPGAILQGATGFLSVNARGQVERTLDPAVFDRGVLHPR